tara:strand:- start:2816 stop:3970 length:1155 start_codon:yes stop_codon:yes gene_type:complete
MAIKQSRGITIGKGTPQRLEGQNGDMSIRSSRKGLKLYVKESNKWHSVDLDIDLRQIASTVRKLEDEVKRLSTKTNNTPVVDKLLLRQPGGASAVGIQNKSGNIAFRNSTDSSDIKLGTEYLNVAANVKTLLDGADFGAVKTSLTLNNVTNESKGTMFTNSVFTGDTTAIEGNAITIGATGTNAIDMLGVSLTEPTSHTDLVTIKQTINATDAETAYDHYVFKMNLRTLDTTEFRDVYLMDLQAGTNDNSTTDNTSRFSVKEDGSTSIGGSVSYKHTAFSTAGPTDSIDVSGKTVLEVDTSSNNVTIGGFSGGVQGQVLYIVKTDTTNFIQLEHNESPAAGSHQKIFLTSGSDERVVGYGGYTLYCNGTNWFSLSNPTGAADAG